MELKQAGSRHWALLIIIAVGYCAAATISIRYFQLDEQRICLWTANVFTVALLLRNPSIPLVPALLAAATGALAANFFGSNTLPMALLFAGTNMVGISVGLLLVRRFRLWNGTGEGVSSYGMTLVATGFAGPAVAALTLALLTNHFYGWSVVDTVQSWIAGDAFAFALLLPVLLYVTKARALAMFKGWAPVRLVFWSAVCATTGVLATLYVDFPFVIACGPLALAAARNKPLPLAIVCAITGWALIGAAIRGDVVVLQRFAGEADGYQTAVAIICVFPFLAGLMFEQFALDRRLIAESEQRFRRAMQDSSIGVGIVALDGRIVEANSAFADMLGYTRQELESRNLFDITHPEDQLIGRDTLESVRAGGCTTYGFEKRYLHKDGTPIWARLSGSVIRDAETGAPLHLVSQIENIDARKRSAAAIAEAENRWDFALASAGQGVWDMDMRRGGTIYSATWTCMLGYEPGELDGDPDRWLSMIHPDDKGMVEAADKAHMAGETEQFEAEFRMRHKAGHWMWILDRGKIFERDSDGNLVRAIGTLTDITKRKETEQRLAHSAALLADEKERLRVTLQSIGDAVICTDAENRVTFMNPIAERLTKVSAGAAVGKPLDHFYLSVDEDSGEYLSPRAEDGITCEVEHNSRAVLVRHDGTRCSIREVISPIVSEHGEFGGSVIVFQDMTDARALQRELAYQAAHDPLTGLFNRSSFMKAMGRLLDEARRDGGQHQLVYLDLDHFKAVNDTSGHAAGDELLKRVTDIIRRTLRPGDIAARLGGDEFAIIFRSATPSAAHILAQRLVDRLRGLEFTWRGQLHAVGASAGVAPMLREGQAVDEIIAAADAACYSAKAAGRGRVAA
ncbi:MAG: PAS domain S-box protein [Rhizobiaceae bacterium]